jgi:outer membrane biosynthesis protein TonB
MKWKFWKAEATAEPVAVEEATLPAPEPEPEPAPTAVVEPEARPEAEPDSEPVPKSEPEPDREPQPEPEPEVPAQISLTIDEAKGVIKEAGGDVIQVGFLASAYRRQLQDDPESAETAASRRKLRDLVGQRLKDRGLLAADGVLELRD